MKGDNRQPQPLAMSDKFNKLAGVFGRPGLIRMMHTRPCALKGFMAGERPLGPRHSERLEFLHGVVCHLEVSHNPVGINEWFDCPRRHFGGRAVRDILFQAWRTDQTEIRRIGQMARAVAAPPSC